MPVLRFPDVLEAKTDSPMATLVNSEVAATEIKENTIKDVNFFIIKYTMRKLFEITI